MNNGYGSRYDQRTKKRKTNLILNSLIGMVLLLIIIVSVNIFFLDNERADDKTLSDENNKIENKESNQGTDSESTNTGNTSSEKEEEETTDDGDSEETETTEESKNVEEEESAEEEAIVSEGGEDSNVLRTIVNPSWKPVGTSQSGEHVTQFGGVDWDEMVQAITYATGLTADNMTILFLGNNGHNKAVGTVYPKDKSQFFKVYIEWVDGQGWKPTMVEELASVQ